MRDSAHFEKLRHLLRAEKAAEHERFTSDRARLSLTERVARGITLSDLEQVDEAVGLGGRILGTFERPERQPFPFRLHPGERVELSPRRPGNPPAEAASAQAIVSRASRHSVQLAFERPPPGFVHDGRVLCDLMPNDVTFARADEAVVKVAGWDKGRERDRRDVLLGRGPARFSPLPELRERGALNPEQKEAVQRALAAEDLFLVHGPPGTGKSTVLAEIAAQAVARGERLCATAASNAAVDHLLELCLDAGLSAVRVGHPARVLPRLQAHTLDLLVESHPDRKLAKALFDEAFDLLGYARKQRARGRSRERFANARSSQAEARKLMDEARTLERKAVRSILDSAQVVCATLSSLPSGPLSSEQFDLALFDEATQAHEPLSLIAFCKAPKVILAGDHHQLPGTVISEEAARGGLSVSLFERLLKDHGDGIRRMLLEQYRMNESICAFSSAEFYEGKLRAHPSVAHHTLAERLRPDAEVEAPPFLFLDTAGKGFEEETEADGESRFNEGEAKLLVAHARALLEAGLSASELAVITPYRAQASRIREALPDESLEVDTVDAFQGREKEAVLVSCVRSNGDGKLGFLTDLRRMNVALTRARRHLFVVGDSATLGGNPFYQRLIAHAERLGGYRSAWEWPSEP